MHVPVPCKRANGDQLSERVSVFTVPCGLPRTMRTGSRWQLNPDTVVGVEATRQGTDATEDANEVRLRAALRF